MWLYFRYVYREVFDLYQLHAGLSTTVLTWNVTDSSSWLKRDPKDHAIWPLLFDVEGQSKPARWVLIKALVK